VDIQQYISSGIIEAYVLGIASDEEVRELLSLSEQYPEVREAISATEADIEQYADLHAITPPPGMKEQIWDMLKEEDATNEQLANVGMANNTVAFRKPEKSTGLRNIAAAAAVILILASAGFNLYLWNKTQQTQQQLASMQESQQQMMAANKTYSEKLAQSYSLLLNPAMKSIMLAGVGTHTQANAMLLWDTQSKNVYLSIKNLPPPPAGKQYQLWAIVNGKPVDAGVYALNAKDDMQQMKRMPEAQMFAITLENEGGSPAPTLDQMIVAGKV